MSDNQPAQPPASQARHRQIHEAGHAVVGHAVGLDVRQASAAGGYTAALSPGRFTEYQKVIACATYRASGQAAESVLLGSQHDEHGAKDRADIEDSRKEHPEWTKDVDDAVDRGTALVEKYRDFIDRVAARLAERPQTVWPEELGRLLADVPQEEPPAASGDSNGGAGGEPQ